MGITYKNGTVLYEGAVISTYTACERVMSDIYADVAYAIVWDEDWSCVKIINYAYYFELADNNGVAVVDATSESLANAEAYAAGRTAGLNKAAAFAAADKTELAAAKAAALTAKRAAVKSDAPRVGDLVEVTKAAGSPKVEKGVSGKVVWSGWSKRHDASWRVGLKTAAGEVCWLPATAVKVIERASEDAESATPAPAPATAAECRVAKGDRVTTADGIAGRIIWVGTDKFSGAARVGIRDGRGETHWVSADNVRAA
jgi:hypothetical protein